MKCYIFSQGLQTPIMMCNQWVPLHHSFVALLSSDVQRMFCNGLSTGIQRPCVHLWKLLSKKVIGYITCLISPYAYTECLRRLISMIITSESLCIYRYIHVCVCNLNISMLSKETQMYFYFHLFINQIFFSPSLPRHF